MPESETTVVFSILGVLAKARDLNQAPALEEIADTLRLGKRCVEHYMTVLEQAGAVRAGILTRYGLERLAGTTVR